MGGRAALARGAARGTCLGTGFRVTAPSRLRRHAIRFSNDVESVEGECSVAVLGCAAEEGMLSSLCGCEETWRRRSGTWCGTLFSPLPTSRRGRRQGAVRASDARGYLFVYPLRLCGEHDCSQNARLVLCWWCLEGGRGSWPSPPWPPRPSMSASDDINPSCSLQVRRGTGSSGLYYCHADKVRGAEGRRHVAAEPLLDLLETGERPEEGRWEWGILGMLHRNCAGLLRYCAKHGGEQAPCALLEGLVPVPFLAAALV